MVPGNKASRELVWWFAECMWLTVLANIVGYVANLV